MAVADKHETTPMVTTRFPVTQVEKKQATVIRFPDADASPPRGIPGKPQTGSSS